MASSTWRVNNSTALGGEVCSPWQANHAYATGARCVCTIAYATVAARAVVFECTDDGTSHATTQPTWDVTVGNTTSDGTVTWTARSPSDGSWDNASCYLAYVLNHASDTTNGGDTVYVDDGHAETTTVYTYLGSKASNNPTKIFCVDKADNSLSTGASVTVDGWSNYIEFWYSGYSYGVCYKKAGYGVKIDGTKAQTPYYVFRWMFESSGTSVNLFELSNSLVSACFVVHGTYGESYYSQGHCIVCNGAISMSNATCCFCIGFGLAEFRNIKLVAASEITYLLSADSGSTTYLSGQTVFEDCDLSALCTGATSRYLLNATKVFGFATIQFNRCKLPSGEGFSVVYGSPLDKFPPSTLTLNHCSASNSVYDFYRYSFYGVIEDSISIYRSGGASNGTTPLSAKMVSSAKCIESFIALESVPITGWTSSTTEKTFTVEGVWDSATNIQDDEIWMELEYPADNSSGLGAIAKDKCAVLGTPANQTASTETWTGTGGFSNENKFKLSVTVTPGKAGPICARVYLAKASTTVYIDPMITES